MSAQELNLVETDQAIINSILSVMITKYGGLSCAPNLANHFPAISNIEMFHILESLADKGVLRRLNSDDPELCRKTRFEIQTIYQIRL